MQDLSERVQVIASSFYQTRSNESFTIFYNTLLPEANKMLRAFIKDTPTLEDISSKIFETILVKPSIFYDKQTELEFEHIASSFFNTKCKHYIHSTPNEDGVKRIQSYFKPENEQICHKSSIPSMSFSDVGKLWLVINKSKDYKITIDGVVILVSEFLEIQNPTNINQIDHNKLTLCPSPFIFNLTKPYLHYFSRIVKTNALSYLKKAKKYQDKHFSGMYSNYDEDDRPQLIANQLSDESTRKEEEQAEYQRQLNEQKKMIIYDIIQQTVPENQRGIIIDAILKKMDYAKIAEKYGLIKVEIDDLGTFKVISIDDDYIKFDNNGLLRTIKITAESKVHMHMGKAERAIGTLNKEEIKFRLVDGTGCLKSRIHRYNKRLSQEVAKTPQFISKCHLEIYTTHYSGGSPRVKADVCETEVNGNVQSIWHGAFISYYSTGEVKAMGRHFLNKKQDIWYVYYKNGQIMKRGMYSADKPDGKWHHFDHDGKLKFLMHYHIGNKGYYEIHEEHEDKMVCGLHDSPLLPRKELKPPLDEILASKLCAKYDNEFAYQTLHFEIPQGY